MIPPIKRGFADTSVGQVHYRAAAPAVAARARPLVMFHGSPSSSKSLERLIANLAASRHVVAFDTMGQGDSCPPPSIDVTMQDYARFYVEALDSLGPSFATVDLFGTHTGGRIAAEIAIASPARVGGVILDGMRRGPSPFWEEYAADQDLTGFIDQDGTQFYKAWSKLRDSFFFFPSYRRDKAHYRGNPLPDAQTLHDYALEVFKGIAWSHVPYRLAVLYPSEERLPLITRPTLVTCAPTDGPFVDLDYVAGLIPGATAKPHPHQNKMNAASDAEIAGLCGMLATWLDGV